MHVLSLWPYTKRSLRAPEPISRRMRIIRFVALLHYQGDHQNKVTLDLRMDK